METNQAAKIIGFSLLGIAAISCAAMIGCKIYNNMKQEDEEDIFLTIESLNEEE